MIIILSEYPTLKFQINIPPNSSTPLLIRAGGMKKYAYTHPNTSTPLPCYKPFFMSRTKAFWVERGLPLLPLLILPLPTLPLFCFATFSPALTHPIPP